MRLHLNIGANSGMRQSRIGEALAAVSLYFGMTGGRVHISAPLRSEPWGFESANEFLNVGVMVDMPGEPTEELLLVIFSELQAIERGICPESHRNADGTYRDREVDIDMISAGIAMDTGTLVLPHPRWHLRPFVTEPMAELEGRGL